MRGQACAESGYLSRLRDLGEECIFAWTGSRLWGSGYALSQTDGLSGFLDMLHRFRLQIVEIVAGEPLQNTKTGSGAGKLLYRRTDGGYRRVYISDRAQNPSTVAVRQVGAGSFLLQQATSTIVRWKMFTNKSR